MPDKAANVMCCDEMDKAVFDAMMNRGLTEAKAGNSRAVADVFADLRQEVRGCGAPGITQGVPNETTAAAIAEGRAIAFDEKEKGFSSVSDLKGGLNE